MNLPENIFAPPQVIEVGLSSELMRIAKMPRRSLAGEDLEELARRMTEILKAPGGSMELRPLQGAALCEIGLHRGLFGMLRVGSGKTLISFLATVVSFAQRPLLLVPADLVEKTSRDRSRLSIHWDMPEFLRVMTYEWLGRAQAADALHDYRPDLIVADEAQKIRNLDAAVTRRVRRYMNEFPETMFVAMSGTLVKRSLHDFAHIVRWCLGPERMFVPRHYGDLEQWAEALDELKDRERAVAPGALQVLCNEEELELWKTDQLKAARSAFRRRMLETPGVVATKQTAVDAGITMNGVELLPGAEVERAFQGLRRWWELPDGRIVLPEGRKIKDGLGMYRHARTLALGFYYIWDPPPPRYWMDARKAWFKFARKILSHSRTLDSEKQVRDKHAEEPELLAWLSVQDDFKPNKVAVWLDDFALRYCAVWAENNAGIIWTEHVAFGERLAREFGLAYYGKKGFAADGAYIEDHPPDRSLVASFKSNHQGKNLHMWSRNLVTSCPANGLQAEQMIGRTHRELQEADEVSFEVLTLCAEHVGAFWQAVSDAETMEQLTGSEQKLLLAGKNVLTPDELFRERRGPRWEKDWAGGVDAA